MTTINVKCVDNSLIMVSSPVVASGGQNAVQIEFEFCQAWEGYGKTAVFFREKTSCDCKTNEVYNVVISDNKALVPNEVLKEKGRFFFGVYGVNEEGTIKTTNRFKYDVVEGSFVEGIEPEDPTPTMYEQILGAYGSAMTRVDQAEATLEGKTEEFAGRIEKINELDNLIKVHNITISREEILDEVGESITGYQALIETISLIYGDEIFNNSLVYVNYEDSEQNPSKCLIWEIRHGLYHITDFVNIAYYERLNRTLTVYDLDYLLSKINSQLLADTSQITKSGLYSIDVYNTASGINENVLMYITYGELCRTTFQIKSFDDWFTNAIVCREGGQLELQLHEELDGWAIKRVRLVISN